MRKCADNLLELGFSSRLLEDRSLPKFRAVCRAGSSYLTRASDPSGKERSAQLRPLVINGIHTHSTGGHD